MNPVGKSPPEVPPQQIYLRFSITDRCGLRCRYCRPAAGRLPDCPTVRRPDQLADSDLLELVSLIHDTVPIYKLRLTGGEPLLHPRLPELVGALRERLPEAQLCLTTNGLGLRRWARELRRAGLDCLNVSLDTLDPDRFSALTRGGSLAPVLEGLRAAREAGFSRLKINSVLLRSYNGDELADLVRLGLECGAEVRFIELMPFGEGAHLHEREFLSAPEALKRLAQTLAYLGPCGRRGTARRHRFRAGDRDLTVGFITTMSAPFCSTCDRVRLDCHGRLYSCLRHAEGADLGAPLRSGSRYQAREEIRRIIGTKPQHGEKSAWPSRLMVGIGG